MGRHDLLRLVSSRSASYSRARRVRLDASCKRGGRGARRAREPHADSPSCRRGLLVVGAVREPRVHRGSRWLVRGLPRPQAARRELRRPARGVLPDGDVHPRCMPKQARRGRAGVLARAEGRDGVRRRSLLPRRGFGARRRVRSEDRSRRAVLGAALRLREHLCGSRGMRRRSLPCVSAEPAGGVVRRHVLRRRSRV
jgi:hypothetical protein